MKRKIIFVNQVSGYLMLDIVNAFAVSNEVEKIKLFTGELNIRPTRPDEKVGIVKTIKYNKKNIISRVFSWSLAFLHLLFYVTFKPNSYELFLVTNPPFTVFLPLFSKKKFSILIYDIYPDTIVSQKIVRNDSWIIKIWEKINRKVFARAEHVFTISEDMSNVVANYIPREQIKVIYNWGHNEHMKPVLKSENSFVEKYNLQEKFIVLYSGNIGLTHDIDCIVELANKLRHDERFMFVIIGEGGKKELIRQQIKAYDLSNCLLLPFQPLEVLPDSMGAADVCVVTTDLKQAALSIPSKTYSYMSVGAAFMCITDKNSELGRFVVHSKMGQSFVASEIDLMTNYLLNLIDDSEMLKVYKNNARKQSLNYTPKNAQIYLNYIINEDEY